jgi:hypothetical protein
MVRRSVHPRRAGKLPATQRRSQRDGTHSVPVGCVPRPRSTPGVRAARATTRRSVHDRWSRASCVAGRWTTRIPTRLARPPVSPGPSVQDFVGDSLAGHDPRSFRGLAPRSALAAIAPAWPSRRCACRSPPSIRQDVPRSSKSLQVHPSAHPREQRPPFRHLTTPPIPATIPRKPFLTSALRDAGGWETDRTCPGPMRRGRAYFGVKSTPWPRFRSVASPGPRVNGRSREICRDSPPPGCRSPSSPKSLRHASTRRPTTWT